MKSVGLVQIFCPVKETNRTHSQSYVEDSRAQTGRKRCTKTVVLNLSVLPSFLFTDFIILRSYIVYSVGCTVQRSICCGFIRINAGFSRFSQYDIMRIKLYDESLNRRLLHG